MSQLPCSASRSASSSASPSSSSSLLISYAEADSFECLSSRAHFGWFLSNVSAPKLISDADVDSLKNNKWTEQSYLCTSAGDNDDKGDKDDKGDNDDNDDSDDVDDQNNKYDNDVNDDNDDNYDSGDNEDNDDDEANDQRLEIDRIRD